MPYRRALIPDVRRGLEKNLDVLLPELFPLGRSEGREYRVGSIAGEPGNSLAVHIGSDKPGIWSDFATGIGGDILDLIAAVHFGGDIGQSIVWGLAWLAARRNTIIQDEHFRCQGEDSSDGWRDAEARSRAALKIYTSAMDRLTGTVGERYLLNRGIDLKSLPRPPCWVRFHPRLWDTERARHWPALVAAITNIQGHPVAIHRTWLKPDGSGKAPLKDPKKTLGSYRGASIHLWPGSHGPPLKDAAPGDAVVIGEGLEDSLTAATAAPEYRVLCAVSLSNLAALELPEAITTVIILGQNDPPGSTAAQALRRAVATFQAQGRTVKIASPPSDYKDFNDVAQRVSR